jgi:hypothetical protein
VEPDHLVSRLRKMRSHQRFSYLALDPEETRALNSAYHGIVRRFARDGIRFQVSNETFGVDPNIGRRKHLRVIMMRPDGVQFGRSWDEGEQAGL